MPKCLLGMISLLAVLASAAPGQETPTASEGDPATPAPGHSVHGEAFDEGPRQRAYLMEGMGKVTFPVSTESEQAGRYMEQGVAQLHSFYYLEAERSFRTAAQLDPGCALAYWGMAMANVNNEKRAREFLKVAKQKASEREVSRRERLYLDALEGKYKDKADAKARRRAWLEGLEAIVEEFPEDLEARAWLGMVTWENAGKGDGIGSRLAVDRLLESVLEANPVHPGAHHYTIHLWDSVKPERAVASAERYASTAPGIAHAWHMPGHTFTGLKRYTDAAYQQEGSARVDHQMMLRDRVMPFEIHNYAHNNQWLATSLSHVGRVRDGLAVARNLVEQPRDPQKNRKDDGGSAQRSGRMRWAELLSRYEMWRELIDDIETGRLDWSDLPLERMQRAYFLGQAHAAEGDLEGLAKQIGVLAGLKPAKTENESKKEGAQAKGAKDAPRAPAGLDSALAELEGYQLLLRGEIDAACERFKKATAMRKEALARAYVKAGRLDEAVSVARKAVEQGANQLPPQVALVEVLSAAGKVAEAREAYGALMGLASAADTDLPFMERLAALKEGWKAGGWTESAGCQPSAEGELKRASLAELGPLGWTPYRAPEFELVDTEGAKWSLVERLKEGRLTVLVFYLGGQCAHCMQQLDLLGKEHGALAALGADVVGISTDDEEATRILKHNSEGVSFPMPLLADPSLAAFKRYRCHDDFEEQPLHGIYLIDEKGGVRFHRVSAEPFLDVEFLKGEVQRLSKLER